MTGLSRVPCGHCCIRQVGSTYQDDFESLGSSFYDLGMETSKRIDELQLDVYKLKNILNRIERKLDGNSDSLQA